MSAASLDDEVEVRMINLTTNNPIRSLHATDVFISTQTKNLTLSG